MSTKFSVDLPLAKAIGVNYVLVYTWVVEMVVVMMLPQTFG